MSKAPRDAEEVQRYSVATAHPKDGRSSYGMMVPDNRGDWCKVEDVRAVMEKAFDLGKASAQSEAKDEVSAGGTCPTCGLPNR